MYIYIYVHIYIYICQIVIKTLQISEKYDLHFLVVVFLCYFGNIYIYTIIIYIYTYNIIYIYIICITYIIIYIYISYSIIYIYICMEGRFGRLEAFKPCMSGNSTASHARWWHVETSGIEIVKERLTAMLAATWTLSHQSSESAMTCVHLSR